jgi:hypothetical protein
MPVRYYVNPANTEGLSASAVTSAVQTAASVWPTQSAANVSFSSAGTTTISSAANDGVNTVMFRPDPNGTIGATTYSWWDGSNHLLDSDIVIWGSDFQFFTGTTGCTGGLYLEDVLAHEFGHVLGLKHSAVGTATMYPTMPGLCLTDWRSLDPDDIAGIQNMYPPVAGGNKAPSAPSSLTAAQNASNPSSSVVLSWSDNATNESGYRIERSVDGVSFGQIAQTSANISSYTDSGLAAGTKYFYRANAFNSSGSSAYSNTASAQTQTVAAAPASTSPGGTVVPPAAQIVDNLAAVWTIGANQAILRNGVLAASGYGSKILWSGAAIYVYAADGNWWKWLGSGWANVGSTTPTTTTTTTPTTPTTPTTTTSADGTLVPPAVQIVDSAAAVWTIGLNQVILRNGAPAAGGLGSKILWSGGSIYVYGGDNNWWKWLGSGWANAGATIPATTVPPPTTPTTPSTTTSADGTLVPPASQIIDSAAAVWTIGANQVILRNGASAAGGLGSKILWSSATIYVYGGDGPLPPAHRPTGRWCRRRSRSWTTPRRCGRSGRMGRSCATARRLPMATGPRFCGPAARFMCSAPMAIGGSGWERAGPTSAQPSLDEKRSTLISGAASRQRRRVLNRAA